MNSQSAPSPGLVYGLYPENTVREPGVSETLEHSLKRSTERFRGEHAQAYTAFSREVHRRAADCASLPEQQLLSAIAAQRGQLQAQGMTQPLLLAAMALISELMRRATGLSPYPSQIMAARIMLDGHLAEMQTGEGKSLAISLAALTAGLAGVPVQVLTANDYLVVRDASALRSVAARMGLKVGAVTSDMDSEKRRHQYARQICYASAKELGFDYLKDQMLPRSGQSDLHRRAGRLIGSRYNSPLLPGLCFALIDEADGILLDEANTPLVLSREYDNSAQEKNLTKAMQLTRLLDTPLHFGIDKKHCEINLTRAGITFIEQQSNRWKGLWKTRRFREGVVKQALSALHCYRRDHDYLVKDGQVHIIDPTTGRLAEGRQWSRGLHQLIELKEGCEPSKQYETIAQITFQNFFPRFLKLGGTSATLSDARKELAKTYGMRVIEVPRHRKSQRQDQGLRVYRSRHEQFSAVIKRVIEMRREQRAVLIGTDSVADSMALSAMLKLAHIEHRVLNARQDSEEADIIAKAGQPRRVTVTTNMAGRGTDIPLSQALKDAGGLHVISCQHNASLRIDKQLHGRCARQGDPGSIETILSLDAPLIAKHLPKRLKNWLTGRQFQGNPIPKWLALPIKTMPQAMEQKKQQRQRKQLRKSDIQHRKWLSIAGTGH
ncbi:MAG: preprotein translocase subunit SecA [bacterium]